jgi:hypothetical protein
MLSYRFSSVQHPESTFSVLNEDFAVTFFVTWGGNDTFCHASAKRSDESVRARPLPDSERACRTEASTNKATATTPL